MRNPLLLTFLVRRHIDGQPLSGRRAALYSRILELIRRTPVTDRAAPDDPGAVVARTGLAALAWKLQSTPGCPRMDALAFVTEELSKASGNSSINSAQLSEAIERFWETRRLLERVQVGSEETITFVHLSLAEFAAAEHLRAMSDAALPKWLADHRRESSWSDTIALACGAGALERIVPLLLAHDDPADPCSAEAILSASALAEAEQPPAELATKVARHLAIRLDSAIPLVSIEAAERLTSLAPIMSDFVEQVCCPRLNHTQNWTRLGAHAALLGTGSNALMAAQATAWLSDQTQVAAISFLRGGLRIDETDAEIPAAGRTLRRKALTRAFEVIFRQLPRDEARSMADQFLSHPGITAAELAEVGFVLAEHDSRDLTARFFSVGGPMPEFGDLKSRGKLATTEFLRLLLDAIGTREVPKRDDSQRRLSNLFIVLDAVDWWRQPLYAIYAFARKEEPDSAVEVLRAVSSVLDVSREGLAAEINHLLTLDDPNPAMFRAADITKRGMEVHWSRGADLAVDPVKLVRGFVHPSDLIQLAAAQLVYAGTGGPVAAAELKSLLPRVINRALLGVAIVGAKVWGNDAQSLLIARFNAEPSEGTEHICKVLADGTCPTKSEEVTALLIGALKHERSSVAYAAAEGIRKLNLDATPQYRARLLGTFTHWQGTDIFCDRCRVVCPYGACPQCHISQKTPIEPLVHELTRAHCLNDTELSSLAQSRWHEVKEAAIIELAEIVRTEEAVLTKFVEQWNREDSLTAVLDKLLLVPKVRLIPIVESLLPLRRSASSKVRVRMVAALPALPCDPQRLADFAQEALTDEAPAVRNAAARSLRMLRMPSAVRDEEDDL